MSDNKEQFNHFKTIEILNSFFSPKVEMQELAPVWWIYKCPTVSQLCAGETGALPNYGGDGHFTLHCSAAPLLLPLFEFYRVQSCWPLILNSAFLFFFPPPFYSGSCLHHRACTENPLLPCQVGVTQRMMQALYSSWFHKALIQPCFWHLHWPEVALWVTGGCYKSLSGHCSGHEQGHKR